MQLITIYDYILLPFYLALFYMIVLRRAKKYNNTDLKKFFITAFFLRVIGSVLYSMVVAYYYGYGDSFIFYEGSSFLRKLILENNDLFGTFSTSGADLSALADKYDVGPYARGTMVAQSNLIVMKISAILSFFSFNLYVIISLFLGFFSFIGTWKLFLVFNDIMKGKASRLLAYVVLYTPSIWFWGSGLIKESICMGALGLTISIVYKAVAKRKFSLKDIFVLLLSFYLLYSIKNYIAGILLASAAASLIGYYVMARSNFFSKLIASLTMLIIGGAIFSLTVADYIDNVVEESASFIEISKTAYVEGEHDQSVGGFTAGDFDLSLQGLILRTPTAVFTTLFRPFLWEIKNVMMLFSALESFIMLVATLYLLVRLRFFRFFSTIFSNSYLIFCFVFAVLMGAVVGLTTFNFGTLVRYRLPLLPFYGFLLVYLYTNLLPREIPEEKPA